MDGYSAVTRRAGWAQIPCAILRAEGRDAVKWLHKIVTADVQSLGTGGGAHSALLDATGHFVADFLVLRDEDALGLIAEPAARGSLFAALQRYIIRDKVQLSDVTEDWRCLTVLGPESALLVEGLLGTSAPEGLYAWAWGRVGEHPARVVKTARARVPAYDVLIRSHGADALSAALTATPRVDEQALEVLRIEAGLPRWGIDFDGTTLALEVPEGMQIRVDQGCYVGQEVVARIVHRGHVNRHLRGLRVAGEGLPRPGDRIAYDGREVGAVTSAADSPRLGSLALGYVRREVEPGSEVTVGEQKARVVELPFAD